MRRHTHTQCLPSAFASSQRTSMVVSLIHHTHIHHHARRPHLVLLISASVCICVCMYACMTVWVVCGLYVCMYDCVGCVGCCRPQHDPRKGVQSLGGKVWEEGHGKGLLMWYCKLHRPSHSLSLITHHSSLSRNAFNQNKTTTATRLVCG